MTDNISMLDNDVDGIKSVGQASHAAVKNIGAERLWTGEKFSQPGIYKSVPMSFYHSDCCVGPSISSSGLREIEGRSPLHYWATSYLNPDRPEEDSTPAMDFGRAVHQLLLSESGFNDEFVVKPETYFDAKTGEEKPWNGNATVCKTWLATQRKAGKTILTAQQVVDINGMAERLSKDQTAIDLLRGRIERSIVTLDKQTGIWVKARPDSIPHDGIIADLKTCADASQVGLQRSILNMGYLQQMALGITCLEAVGQKRVDTAVLLFVETSYPYAYNIKPLDNGDIYTAMRQNRRALNVFAECLKANDWPTYGDNTLTWSAPKWWTDRAENDSTLPEIQKDRAA